MPSQTAAWAGIVVTLPPSRPSPDAVEVLGALLVSLGATGLEEEESRLTAYFPVDADLEARAAAAAAHATRLLGRDAAVERRAVPPVDWVETWRREVRATAVVPGIVVAPTWERYQPSNGEAVIRLDPGMAFGTGSHASTRLCLAALAARPPRGLEVLDLGTGSGILAIAAARLGARRVTAVDLDPIATAAAEANVALNEVADRVRVATGDLAVAPGPFDLVLANILAGPLVQMAGDLSARLGREGLVTLSGLLAAEAPDVAAAYVRAGLTLVESPRETDESGLEWAALVLTR